MLLLLQVDDEATLQDQQLPGAVVLTQAALRQLPWRLAQRVDQRPARGMLAALYAIHQGAEIIYSWDADAPDAGGDHLQQLQAMVCVQPCLAPPAAQMVGSCFFETIMPPGGLYPLLTDNITSW
jgi:hypothetical protein